MEKGEKAMEEKKDLPRLRTQEGLRLEMQLGGYDPTLAEFGTLVGAANAFICIDDPDSETGDGMTFINYDRLVDFIENHEKYEETY